MMSSCTSFIVALGLMICFVWWMVVSEFLLLELLFWLALIAIVVIIALVIFAMVIWVIKELFS